MSGAACPGQSVEDEICPPQAITVSLTLEVAVNVRVVPMKVSVVVTRHPALIPKLSLRDLEVLYWYGETELIVPFQI